VGQRGADAARDTGVHIRHEDGRAFITNQDKFNTTSAKGIKQIYVFTPGKPNDHIHSSFGDFVGEEFDEGRHGPDLYHSHPFIWFAHYFQDARAKFGEFIQEQHAPVRQRCFARLAKPCRSIIGLMWVATSRSTTVTLRAGTFNVTVSVLKLY
jgi:hypothetical protein